MNSRTLIWIGLFIGSAIGGFIPSLWGSGLFSFSSIIFETLGGLVGIWAGYKAGSFI